MIYKPLIQFLAGPVAYQQGLEGYLELFCLAGLHILFFHAIWTLGIFAFHLPGSDEPKSISFKNVVLMITALVGLHLGASLYSRFIATPKFKETKLDIATSNEIAEMAHRHEITVSKAVSVARADMGIDVNGEHDNLSIFIGDKWFTSEESKKHLRVMLEEVFLEQKNQTTLKACFIGSSLFGAGLIVLAHLYVAPLTSILAANYILAGITAQLVITYTKYALAAFSRHEVYKIDAQAAKAINTEKVIDMLRFFKSQITYDEDTLRLPTWKLCFPRISSRIAHLETQTT